LFEQNTKIIYFKFSENSAYFRHEPTTRGRLSGFLKSFFRRNYFLGALGVLILLSVYLQEYARKSNCDVAIKHLNNLQDSLERLVFRKSHEKQKFVDLHFDFGSSVRR
jgi:hypothetical protein